MVERISNVDKGIVARRHVIPCLGGRLNSVVVCALAAVAIAVVAEISAAKEVLILLAVIARRAQHAASRGGASERCGRRGDGGWSGVAGSRGGGIGSPLDLVIVCAFLAVLVTVVAELGAARGGYVVAGNV